MVNEQQQLFLKQTLTFWPQLTTHQESTLLSNTELLHYPAGTNVHSTNHECVGVLLVQSGELRCYMLSEDGREITLYRLGAGEFCVLSASCVLSCITFDIHIDAQQESEVLLINAAVFATIIEQNVYVENFVLRIGMERFSDVMWVMEQILFMSFDRRLAIFLIDETTKLGTDHLTLTHEQMAKYMGSAREVVSRMLKHFSAEGMVEIYRGGIKILDRAKLKKLIH